MEPAMQLKSRQEEWKEILAKFNEYLKRAFFFLNGILLMLVAQEVYQYFNPQLNPEIRSARSGVTIGIAPDNLPTLIRKYHNSEIGWGEMITGVASKF